MDDGSWWSRRVPCLMYGVIRMLYSDLTSYWRGKGDQDAERFHSILNVFPPKSYIPVNWFLIIRVNSQSICMTTCLPFTYLIKLQLLPHANGSAFRRHRYNTHPLAHHIPDVHIVARAPNGHLIVRSLACSLHAPKMSDNEEENFTWICGNENITHRRHIGDGGFAEVHEVMWYCQVWLTMQMMDDLTGKVHTSTCRRY